MNRLPKYARGPPDVAQNVLYHPKMTVQASINALSSHHTRQRPQAPSGSITALTFMKVLMTFSIFRAFALVSANSTVVAI